MKVDEVMQERARLIARKFSHGLDSDETARLAFLNEEAQRLVPRVDKRAWQALEADMLQVEALSARIKASSCTD